jgi:PAS domain S-box-containing protein
MKPLLPVTIVVLLMAHPQPVMTARSGVPEQPTDEPLVGTVTAPPRRVLALYWYPHESPVTETFDRRFQAVLKRKPGEIESFTEYFESGRFPGEKQERIMRDYLRQKYADRKIDVILAWGSWPVEFLVKYRESLFPDTPIVYYVGTLEAIKGLAAPPMTGVFNPDAYAKTLELALKLHPDTTDVFLVSGTPAHDRLIEREAASQFERLRGRAKLTYLTDLPIDQLIATVRDLPEQSIVLYSRQSQERADQVLAPGDFLELVSRSASAPVYSPWKSLLGHGTTGGIVDDPEAGATKAAEMVLRIARGARPQDIPAVHVPTTPTFDARQLARWGISEAELPAGSVVLFREPTVWSQYRSYIIATAAALAAQTILIAALLVQRARRRRVEGALRESEERFRVMADTAPVMVWRSGTDGRCDFFNQPWFEFRGRTLEQEAGDGWMEGVHAQDLERCKTTYRSSFDERRPFRIEYRLQRADGEYRWVLVTGVPRFAPGGAFAGYIGSCLDITERRQAEQDLHENQKRYALATAAGDVGVWDWDLETNDIWIDPSLRLRLGFDDHDPANRLDSWIARVHPEDARRLLDDARAHVNGNSPYYETEHRKVHKDGSVRWFLTRGSAVRLPDGRAVRIIGTDTDITDRKIADVQLEEMRHELTRVSRVTMLSQFAASIAHEVSQPLNAVFLNAKACLRWIENSTPSSEDLRPALRDISEAALRANEVIARNRELFRHRKVEQRLLDLNSVVRNVAGLAQSRLQQSLVVLESSLEDDLPAVLGDRVELQQVLLNLVLNGIEAMVSVDAHSRRLRIETRLTAANLVQVAVRDAGVGLGGIDVKRLFTPFYSTKSSGTGVGLSISRLIVEAHGGMLWAEAHDGPGTTFYFTIPVATAKASEPSAPERPAGRAIEHPGADGDDDVGMSSGNIQ